MKRWTCLFAANNLYVQVFCCHYIWILRGSEFFLLSIECYVQLKESNHRQCPFCNRESLIAEFNISAAVSSPSSTITKPSPSPPSSSNGTSIKLSVSDRENLEAEIRNQRVNSYEFDSRGNSRSSSVDVYHQLSSRTIQTPVMSPSTGTQSNQSNRTRNRVLSDESGERDSFDFFHNGAGPTIHQLLGIDELEQLASLQQLEEFMLMEVVLFNISY